MIRSTNTRNLAALLAALVASLVLGSCIDALPESPIEVASLSTGTLTIFGTVSASGSGLGGVQVTLSGPVCATTTTLSSGIVGRYFFQNLPAGVYHLGFSRSGMVNSTAAARQVILQDTDVSQDVTLVALPSGVQAPGMAISTIQGRGHISPWEGRTVQGVCGLVTMVEAVDYFGNELPYLAAYLESTQADDDDYTSEALQLYIPLGTDPGIEAGDLVYINQATVFEDRRNYPYLDYTYSGNLSRTQLRCDASQITVLQSGCTLAPAQAMGVSPDSTKPEKRLVPDLIAPNLGGGSVEDSGYEFRPDLYAIDFYESMECMRVTMDNVLLTAPVDEYGETWGSPDNGDALGNRSINGGALLDNYQAYSTCVLGILSFDHSYYIRYDGIGSLSLPARATGSIFTRVTGWLDYSRNAFGVRSSQTVAGTAHTVNQETTGLTGDATHLTVASFNVENLSRYRDNLVNRGFDPYSPSHIEGIAGIIRNNLRFPDILGLVEVQDDSGETDDGTLGCEANLSAIANEVGAIPGGGQYAWTWIDPLNDTEGGAPGGNIRLAFFYNPNRVSLISQAPPDGVDPTLDSVRPVARADGSVGLSWSPGRLFADAGYWRYTRRPLAAEFAFNGQKLIVIANHWNSKGGDEPYFGPNQPPTLGSEAKRLVLAEDCATWIRDALAIQSDARIIMLGDFNDYQFSPPIRLLEDQGMHNMYGLEDSSGVYSYIYQGHSQVLDHMLVSPALWDQSGIRSAFDVVRVNRDIIFSYSTVFSDHEPTIGRFEIP